jgi:hypothetical protein
MRIHFIGLICFYTSFRKYSLDGYFCFVFLFTVLFVEVFFGCCFIHLFFAVLGVELSLALAR